MEFKYLENDKNHHLIEQFYLLKLTKADIPFTTPILPLGLTNITYVFSDKDQVSVHNNHKTYYRNLIITGQYYGCFNILINDASLNIGFELKPTSLYKILDKDISEITNKKVLLKDLHLNLYEKLNPIFLKHKHDSESFSKSVYKLFDALKLSEDKNIEHIDKAIDLIIEKRGLLKVTDVLKEVPYSQKSLEIQFKKIIGLTPGKYIRQYRFINLMKKYQSNKMNINDLIYEYNYYDSSHFAKDFKLFMNQNFRDYFKEDYPILKEYLK